MKHERYLIYEGPKEWLESQLSKSLPEGTKIFKDSKYGEVSIKVVIVNEYYKPYLGFKLLLKSLKLLLNL